jgi:hypothetical protein
MNYVANFLAQTEDGVLHSYWHLDILICEYKRALREGIKLTLFTRENVFGSYKYSPISYESLVQLYESENVG